MTDLLATIILAAVTAIGCVAVYIACHRIIHEKCERDYELLP